MSNDFPIVTEDELELIVIPDPGDFEEQRLSYRAELTRDERESTEDILSLTIGGGMEGVWDGRFDDLVNEFGRKGRE